MSTILPHPPPSAPPPSPPRKVCPVKMACLGLEPPKGGQGGLVRRGKASSTIENMKGNWEVIFFGIES